MVERTAVMKKERCGSRRRRHAFYAAAFVAAATMLTLAANAGSAALHEGHGLRIDISKEQYTVLTDETKNILAGLNREVYLYYTGRTDLDDLRVTQLLKSYAAASPRVFYHLVDPSIHPGFTQLYDPQQTGIDRGSIIVSDSDGLSGAAPGRFEVLPKEDLYYSSAPYYDDNGRLVSDYKYFRAEQKVTSAINYIITDQNLSAVFLGGEKLPTETLVSDLSGLFYQTRTSDLTDKSLNPLSDTLVVISPQADFSEDALEKINAFLEQGGKAIFFIDSVSEENTESFSRLDALLSGFGLLVQRNVIVGADPAHTYMSRMSLVPSLSQDSPVTQPLIDSGLKPVLSNAGAITVSYIDGVETAVLLQTDASSYAKAAEKAFDSCSKQPDDITGPFVIGVLAKKGNAQIALFSTSSLVSTEAGYGIPGNRRLLLNTFSYMNGRQESGIIPMRTVYSASDNAYKLDIASEFEKVFYIGLTAVAMPLIVLIIGISKWYRRRHM
jgi:ABC-type uncharacterized transport system involved in gliding motility auxiliary subunit